MPAAIGPGRVPVSSWAGIAARRESNSRQLVDDSRTVPVCRCEPQTGTRMGVDLGSVEGELSGYLTGSMDETAAFGECVRDQHVNACGIEFAAMVLRTVIVEEPIATPPNVGDRSVPLVEALPACSAREPKHEDGQSTGRRASATEDIAGYFHAASQLATCDR